MAEIQEEGWIRGLGVSNFPAKKLRHASSIAPIICNQIEFHPFLAQETLLAVAEELRVAITAHSPLAFGRVFEDEVLNRVAARHGKTAVQVTLR
jgi:diketogulonate reductase-like aldo/keto reductase